MSFGPCWRDRHAAYDPTVCEACMKMQITITAFPAAIISGVTTLLTGLTTQR